MIDTVLTGEVTDSTQQNTTNVHVDGLAGHFLPAAHPATTSAPSARRPLMAGEPCLYCGAAPCPTEVPTGLEAVHIIDSDGAYLGRAVAVVEGHLAPYSADARRWRDALERELVAWVAARRLGRLAATAAELRAEVAEQRRPGLTLIDGGADVG
jgi:hypothetical protein